jgi:hypothetical protein
VWLNLFKYEAAKEDAVAYSCQKKWKTQGQWRMQCSATTMWWQWVWLLLLLLLLLLLQSLLLLLLRTGRELLPSA